MKDRAQHKGGRFSAAAFILCSIALMTGIVCIRGGCSIGQGGRSGDRFFYDNLAPGWNLGNALDAHVEGFHSRDLYDYERQWHNPVVSGALFEAVANAGFRSVRIPVTWYQHMDADGKVDPQWMNRVQQVVDDALDAGLYVIINSHHDSWYAPFPERMPKAEATLSVLWAQIADAFSGYDTRLLFEGMNEPRLMGTEQEWMGGTPEARAGVNRLNAVFVETIRSSGGLNPKRYLLIPTYGASTVPEALSAFRFPEDSRLAVSIHLYQPFDFAHELKGTASWSGKNPQDTGALDYVFSQLDRTFVSRKIPVVITEYGAIDKNNIQARIAWATYTAQAADRRRIPCLWWDGGVDSKTDRDGTFALLDRDSLRWIFPPVTEALTGKPVKQPPSP